MTNKICKECGRNISSNNILKHVGSKNCKKIKSTLPEFINIIEEKFECTLCNKIFSKNGIHTHVWRIHGNGINFDGNIQGFIDGIREAWNKGLTKDTSVIIKDSSEKCSKTSKGKPGHPHTEESKQKLRDHAIKNGLGGHISKQRNIFKNILGEEFNLHSSYELIVANSLNENDILWVRPNPLIWIDEENIKHRYYAGFYLPEFDIYLDPKNDFLIKKDFIKIQSVRNQNNKRVFVLDSTHLKWENIKILAGLI